MLIGRELRSLSLQSPLGDYSNDGFRSLSLQSPPGDYSNDGFQFSKWWPDLLMIRSCKLCSFVLFSWIITSAILLKQLAISGSANIAIVISTSSLHDYSLIFTSPSVTSLFLVRDVSLFSWGGRATNFLNKAPKKFWPSPWTLKKNCDPPHFYSVIFFKTQLPWIELPSHINSCLTDAQSVSYFF